MIVAFPIMMSTFLAGGCLVAAARSRAVAGVSGELAAKPAKISERIRGGVVEMISFVVL